MSVTLPQLYEIKGIGWQRIRDGDTLPDYVTRAVLRAHGGKIEPFEKPKHGWSPVLGWKEWFPLP